MNDYVDDDYNRCVIAKPYDKNFNKISRPTTVEEYRSYISSTSDLVKRRNQRIADWAKYNL